MMKRFHLYLFFVIIINPNFISGFSTYSNKLVNNVCNQTSNYKFCITSLYSDPRTPSADRVVLAYISFGLAYLNATKTRDHVAVMMKNASSTTILRRLKKCAGDYDAAVAKLEEAYNDLDSETYEGLDRLGGVAARSADDCQAAVKGTFPYLTVMNRNLKGLSVICVIVGKLFT